MESEIKLLFQVPATWFYPVANKPLEIGSEHPDSQCKEGMQLVSQVSKVLQGEKRLNVSGINNREGISGPLIHSQIPNFPEIGTLISFPIHRIPYSRAPGQNDPTAPRRMCFRVSPPGGSALPLSSWMVGGTRTGLRNLSKLMMSFWLNINKVVSLMLSRITHRGLKGRTLDREECCVQIPALFFGLCANLSTSTCLSQPQPSHLIKGVKNACWGKRLRQGWRMIIVTNAKNSHMVKDPVLLSYRGGNKKGPTFPERKATRASSWRQEGKW